LTITKNVTIIKLRGYEKRNREVLKMYEGLISIRTKMNVKGEQLANLLGVTVATYSRKENGIIKFSLNEAKKIADYFKLKVEDIFFDHEVTENGTKEA
jgi:DNA-binding XRE family transcriptional regulator